MTNRSTAFFINGGAGRVLSSIPALELYAQENPLDDFIIVCEGGMDLYKGHPTLHQRAYDNFHKDLFTDKLKDRNCLSPEPYRVWEYYNQKCSLAQAFDICINNKGIRDLKTPIIYLGQEEFYAGINTIKEVKEKTKKTKIIVIQPFGRSSYISNELRMDHSGRSLSLADTVEIIKLLQKDYGIMLMSDQQLDTDKLGLKDPIAIPQGINIRQWAGLIAEADYFVGIDSVGQHIANSFNKKATVLMSATYPINVSYPNNTNFNILDFGSDKRKYDPIRLTVDEVVMRNNEPLLQLNSEAIQYIVKSIKSHIDGNKTKDGKK